MECAKYVAHLTADEKLMQCCSLKKINGHIYWRKTIVNGGILLKWDLNKCNIRVWTSFNIGLSQSIFNAIMKLQVARKSRNVLTG